MLPKEKHKKKTFIFREQTTLRIQTFTQPRSFNWCQRKCFVVIVSIWNASKCRYYNEWKEIAQAHIELEHIFNRCCDKLKFSNYFLLLERKLQWEITFFFLNVNTFCVFIEKQWNYSKHSGAQGECHPGLQRRIRWMGRR